MSNDSIEDRLVLARGGTLSEPEQRRLEIALNTSESARALFEAGLAFDHMHTDSAGDPELLARVSARTAARVLGNRTRTARKSRTLSWLAAGMLLVSGAAAASLWQVERIERARPSEPHIDRRTPPKAKSPGPGQRSREADPGAARVAPSPSSGEQTLLGAPNDSEPLAASNSPSLAPALAVRADSASGGGARGLFKAANDARKSGDPARALALYQKLQQRFPASSEAQVSLVLSGRLLLASGQTSRALSQFDGYLKAGARGGLAEEALSGKAQALAGLGRIHEERQVWQTLLSQYPNSVYVRTARERLR